MECFLGNDFGVAFLDGLPGIDEAWSVRANLAGICVSGHVLAMLLQWILIPENNLVVLT